MIEPILYLLTKAPVPGRVKTRMIDAVGPDKAAAVAAGLIAASVGRASVLWPGPVVLAVRGNPDIPFFRQLHRRYPVEIEAQGAGDLGQEMARTLARGVARAGAAAVMGCDIPHCPAPVLHAVHKALRNKENVIGPAADGGFYLLGLCSVPTGLLEGIRWGVDTVLRDTIAHLAGHGVSIDRELPTLRDVDTVEDLACALDAYPALSGYIQGADEIG